MVKSLEGRDGGGGGDLDRLKAPPKSLWVPEEEMGDELGREEEEVGSLEEP